MTWVAASCPFLSLMFGSSELLSTIKVAAMLSNKAQLVKYTISSTTGLRIKAQTRLERRQKRVRTLKAVLMVLFAPFSDSNPMHPVSMLPSYSSKPAPYRRYRMLLLDYVMCGLI